MQDAVVDMDPISLSIRSLDVKEAFPNSPRRRLPAVWKRMGLPFQGFLQAYLATRMYAVEPNVGTTPWIHPTSGIPQGGAEGPFLSLLITLPLAFYPRHTYPGVAPYPLQTTLLAFADDMGVVTATAREPLPTTPETARPPKYSMMSLTTWRATSHCCTTSNLPPWYTTHHRRPSAPETRP